VKRAPLAVLVVLTTALDVGNRAPGGPVPGVVKGPLPRLALAENI
jgi:hypothetical protein